MGKSQLEALLDRITTPSGEGGDGDRMVDTQVLATIARGLTNSRRKKHEGHYQAGVRSGTIVTTTFPEILLEGPLKEVKFPVPDVVFVADSQVVFTFTKAVESLFITGKLGPDRKKLDNLTPAEVLALALQNQPWRARSEAVQKVNPLAKDKGIGRHSLRVTDEKKVKGAIQKKDRKHRLGSLIAKDKKR